MFKKFIFSITLLLFSYVFAKNIFANNMLSNTGTKYYVSNREIVPSPTVRDGSSWSKAWKELSDIKWKTIDGSGVQAGDTVFIDGGTNISYKTPLTIKGSGNETTPITVRIPLRDDPDSENGSRSGSITITGSENGAPLADSCTQVVDPSDRKYTRSDIAPHGIDFTNQSYITIDGGVWEGIKITKFSNSGIQINPGSKNITIRNVEIFDNGNAHQDYLGYDQVECQRVSLPTRNIWETDSPGITAAGTDIKIENANIHDNGQDQISTGQSDFNNLTINKSWLHNQRSHKSIYSDPFNFQTHSDGVQAPASNILHHLDGLHINQSIIGPGLMHGLILGEPNDIIKDPHHSFDVNDVTLNDVLMVSHFGNFFNANILAKSPIANTEYPKNWRIDKVTSVINAKTPNHNFFSEELKGSNHIATNTIFTGGIQNEIVGFDNRSINNCSNLDRDNIPSYKTKNIFFANYDELSAGLDKTPLGADNPKLNQFDLTLTTNTDSNCRNSGTSITSLQALLTLITPNPVTPSPTLTLTPTTAPTITPTPTVTSHSPTGIVYFYYNDKKGKHKQIGGTITLGRKTNPTFPFFATVDDASFDIKSVFLLAEKSDQSLATSWGCKNPYGNSKWCIINKLENIPSGKGSVGKNDGFWNYFITKNIKTTGKYFISVIAYHYYPYYNCSGDPLFDYKGRTDFAHCDASGKNQDYITVNVK